MPNVCRRKIGKFLIITEEAEGIVNLPAKKKRQKWHALLTKHELICYPFMSKIDDDLIAVAERYVLNLLDKKLPGEYLFHCKNHTLSVVKGAELIGSCSGLNDQELKLLRLSALFHDVGYILTDEDHESESSFIANEFLRANLVDKEQISLIQNAIRATKVPQQPNDRISEVLCDADLLHLAGDDYFEQMELLRLEWQITGKNFMTEHEFHLNSIDFFNKHQYHSEYGKTLLTRQKAETLKKIKERTANGDKSGD